MANYSLDIDGVVADYLAARAAAAQEMGIRPLSQPVGMEPEELDAFMGERVLAVNKAMRKYISDHLEEFFGGLACTVTPEDRQAIQRAAAMGHELFWISNRYVSTALVQITLDWLNRNGLPADYDHIILTRDKATVIRERSIHHHLDDRVAQVTSIALQSTAKVFLLRRPWNQHFLVRHPDEPDADYMTSAGAYGVDEVDSIAEYITFVVGK